MTDEIITCPNTGELLKHAEAPRPEWKMPGPPLECVHYVYDTEVDEVSHRVTMIPGCHIEDSWELFWFCPECEAEDFDGLEIDWPFRFDEYANLEDLEKLGFTEVG